MSLPLAIVLPVWRARFLDETLASIAAQTRRDFVVCIGDDASPDDIAALCARWQPHLPALRYRRFDHNLGGTDLVAQWQRCLALAEEPWVWLFSDDDRMPPDAVARLLAAIDEDRGAPWLYHFDVTRIDAQGQVLGDAPAYPPVLSARAYARHRLRFELQSYAPDFVCSRQALQQMGGFVPFPRAWCSDDATWIALAKARGIRTLPGARVQWRSSGENISSRHTHDAPAKFEALLGFLVWFDAHLRANPAGAGEPDDAALLKDAPRWFFRQVRALGLGFDAERSRRVLEVLAPLRGFGALALHLRLWHARWRQRRRPAASS